MQGRFVLHLPARSCGIGPALWQLNKESLPASVTSGYKRSWESCRLS